MQHGTNLLSDGHKWATFAIGRYERKNYRSWYDEKMNAGSMAEWSFEKKSKDMNTNSFELKWMWPGETG